MNPIPFGKRRSVLQDWVHNLTFMQQSVLIAAVRGPDGLRKDHCSKVLCRWLRRCFLFSAFQRRPYDNPWELGGGSFTGPSCLPEGDFLWEVPMDKAVEEYLRHVDEMPHHFQLHFMHAAEILGYKHENLRIRAWWHRTYITLVNDAHLWPESEAQMDRRLGDFEAHWREREEVTAKGPSI